MYMFKQQSMQCVIVKMFNVVASKMTKWIELNYNLVMYVLSKCK
jgi:hypothetical protein